MRNLFFIPVALLLFSSCNPDIDDRRIIGTWKLINCTYEIETCSPIFDEYLDSVYNTVKYSGYRRFEKDGTMWYASKDDTKQDNQPSDTYSVKDGILYVCYKNGSLEEIKYEIKGNLLTLISESGETKWYDPPVEFECDSEPMIKNIIEKKVFERQ